jgi:hypothetical protein
MKKKESERKQYIDFEYGWEDRLSALKNRKIVLRNRTCVPLG